MNVEQLQNAEDGDNTEVVAVDELATLKTRATTMGISFHPAIKTDALRAKISAKLNDLPDPDETKTEASPPAPAGAVLTKAEDPAEETPGARRARLRREANELVRIVLSTKDPKKKEWEGEIFTTGNAVIGTIKKFVPFDVEEGWHVPRAIYNMLKARECQIFVNRKVKQGDKTQMVREGKIIKEFLIEVLPPLTPAELKDLAQRQAMANGAQA